MRIIARAAPLVPRNSVDMNQVVAFLCALCALIGAVSAKPQPDSAGAPPLPGPGLSYGGIPYGSMTGNVAEYFKHQLPPNGRRSNFAGYAPSAVDYTPIEQWL